METGAKQFPASLRDRALIAEAILLLIVAKVLIALLPYERWASRLLGTQGTATPENPLPPAIHIRVFRVRRAIGYAIQRLPGKGARFNCLIRGIAGMWMLNRRRIPSTLYLGVQRIAEDSGAFRIRSHAWLRCGDWIISGDGPHRKEYTEIARFGSKYV